MPEPTSTLKYDLTDLGFAVLTFPINFLLRAIPISKPLDYNDAQSYERWTRENNYVAPWYFGNRLLPFLQEHSTILDVGCGTGQSGEPFIHAGHSVSGIDKSASTLFVLKGEKNSLSRTCSIRCFKRKISI